MTIDIDLTPYKVEIVPGINDQPEPPNYLNNGKGCNGAYFLKQYHDLIDALMFQGARFTSFTGPATNGTTVEVGAPLLSPNTPINLRAVVNLPANVQSLTYYINGAAVSGTFMSGDTHTYLFSSYTGEPNLFTRAASYEWSATGVDTFDNPIANSPTLTVNWRYRTYFGQSSNPNLSDPLALGVTLGSTLTRPGSFDSPAANAPYYFYIFLPTGQTGSQDGWSPYSQFTVAGFDAVMDTPRTVTVTRLGVPVTYRIYRLFFETQGSFTLVAS